MRARTHAWRRRSAGSREQPRNLEKPESHSQAHGGNKHLSLAVKVSLTVRIDDSESDNPDPGEPIEDDAASGESPSDRERRFRIEECRISDEQRLFREQFRHIG